MPNVDLFRWDATDRFVETLIKLDLLDLNELYYRQSGSFYEFRLMLAGVKE